MTGKDKTANKNNSYKESELVKCTIFGVHLSPAVSWRMTNYIKKGGNSRDKSLLWKCLIKVKGARAEQALVINQFSG